MRATRIALPILAVTALGAAGSGAAVYAASDSPSTASTILATKSAKATPGANTAEVVAKADAFLATLSDTQRDTVEYDFGDQAVKSGWSNLPASGSGARNGLSLGELTDAQQAAALSLMQSALSQQGYKQLEDLRTVDDYLGTQSSSGGGGGGTPPTGTTPGGGTPPTGTTPGGGTPPAGTTPGGTPPTGTTPTGGGGGNTYSSDNYYISVFGTPSTTGRWLLQYTGHHMTFNVGYDGDKVTFGPEFAGVEPKSVELNGETIAPVKDATDAITATLGDLTDAQKSTALLSSSFDDLLLGAQNDGPFPSQPEGVTVSDLSQEAQDHITDLIRAYVGDLGSDAAENKVKEYVAAYPETKFSYAGGTDVTAQGFYARLDGPVVWIELSTQAGVVLSGTHYHSIYREEGSDYNEGSSTSTTDTTATTATTGTTTAASGTTTSASTPTATTTAAAAKLSFSSGTRRAATVTVGCSVTCTTKLTATLSSATAKRLGVSKRRYATATKTFVAGRHYVRVRLTSKLVARAQAKGLKKLVVTVKATTTYNNGKSYTATRTLSVRR